MLGHRTLFTRVLGIASAGNRVISGHPNLGATFASKNFSTVDLIGEPDDEINYTLGLDWSVVPQATLSADLLGRRRVSGTLKYGLAPRTLQFVRTAGGPVETHVVNEFEPTSYGDRHLMQAIIGGKLSAWRTLQLVGNVLLPVTDAGLRNKPGLSFGIEYTFAK